MEGVSRAKISRLLDNALKEGIVQIKIAYPVWNLHSVFS